MYCIPCSETGWHAPCRPTACRQHSLDGRDNHETVWASTGHQSPTTRHPRYTYTAHTDNTCCLTRTHNTQHNVFMSASSNTLLQQQITTQVKRGTWIYTVHCIWKPQTHEKFFISLHFYHILVSIFSFILFRPNFSLSSAAVICCKRHYIKLAIVIVIRGIFRGGGCAWDAFASETDFCANF